MNNKNKQISNFFRLMSNCSIAEPYDNRSYRIKERHCKPPKGFVAIIICTIFILTTISLSLSLVACSAPNSTSATQTNAISSEIATSDETVSNKTNGEETVAIIVVNDSSDGIDETREGTSVPTHDATSESTATTKCADEKRADETIAVVSGFTEVNHDDLSADEKPTETAPPSEPVTEWTTTHTTEVPATVATETIPPEDTNTVTFADVSETVYANTTVNVRSGAGVDYEKLGTLNPGDSVFRIGIGSNGWSKVMYNDIEAFMFSDYLTTKKPEAPAAPSNSGIPSGGTIQLKVEPATIEEFLGVPNESDFGVYYENAIALYTAVIENQEDIWLIFDSGSSVESHTAYADFVSTFKSKVLKDKIEFWTNYTETGPSIPYVKVRVLTGPMHDEFVPRTEFYYANLSAGLYDGMTEKDAVTTINNWICDTLSYETGASDPCAALKNGYANCSGYAKLFHKMCNNAGINCEYVTGMTTAGYHAWNRVNLSGTWYYLDVCWNDSPPRNRYFLSQTLWENHNQ